MYRYDDDDAREFAARDAAHRVAREEREKAEKEKAELVRMIFANIAILLVENAETINFTDGTNKRYFNEALKNDIDDLEKKCNEKYRKEKNGIA